MEVAIRIAMWEGMYIKKKRKKKEDTRIEDGGYLDLSDDRRFGVGFGIHGIDFRSELLGSLWSLQFQSR